MTASNDGVPAPIKRRLDSPDEADPGDFLRAIEGGETALHVTLKDDKQWWLAHNPNYDVPGELNGPWLHWSTYPSGAWTLNYNTRQIMHHVIDELWYVDYDGDRAHSIHAVRPVPLDEAPEFVRTEFNRIEEP